MKRQPKIVVYKDKAGKYRWRVVAGNGEPVAASQSYANRHIAVDAAYRLQGIIESAEVVSED